MVAKVTLLNSQPSNTSLDRTNISSNLGRSTMIGNLNKSTMIVYFKTLLKIFSPKKIRKSI